MNDNEWNYCKDQIFVITTNFPSFFLHIWTMRFKSYFAVHTKKLTQKMTENIEWNEKSRSHHSRITLIAWGMSSVLSTHTHTHETSEKQRFFCFQWLHSQICDSSIYSKCTKPKQTFSTCSLSKMSWYACALCIVFCASVSCKGSSNETCILILFAWYDLSIYQIRCCSNWTVKRWILSSSFSFGSEK